MAVASGDLTSPPSEIPGRNRGRGLGYLFSCEDSHGFRQRSGERLPARNALTTAGFAAGPLAGRAGRLL